MSRSYAVCLLMATALHGQSLTQSSFSRTYAFPDSLRMTCCSGQLSGLTSVINDPTVTGPTVQISSITVTGTIHVASLGGLSRASFDWQVFIGPSPSTLPPGETTGNPNNIFSGAPVQFFSAQSAPASAGSVVNFEAHYDFGSNSFTASPSGQIVSASAAWLTLTHGLYIQVFSWSAAPSVDLTLSNIAVVVNGVPPPPPLPGQPTTTVVHQVYTGSTYSLYPWFGAKVALLTPQYNLDTDTMNKTLAGLDAAWTVYEQITGSDPVPSPQLTLNGRDIIAVVPDASIPGCAACSYLGANGTEFGSTYFSLLYNGVKDRDEFDWVMFYEFGRNFWFYQNPLAKMGPQGDWATSFAIANGFISLDRAGLKGGPFRGQTWMQVERSKIDLLNKYLADPSLSWQNTLLTGTPPSNPYGWGTSDLAGAMLYRLYDDFGFDSYKAFWKALQSLPTANTPDDTIRNFLSAAMSATGRNYGFLFKGSYDAPPVDLCSLTPAAGTAAGAEASTGSISFTTSRDYCTWTASASGASWVHLSVTSGTGSGTLPYSVDANTTGQTRSTVILLGKASFTLVQNATPSVAPSVTSVVNGATFRSGIAPGSWITIQGQALAFGPQTAASASSPLPSLLAGVQVLVNGNPIPLEYVSPSQINAQLPYETPLGAGQLAVSNYGTMSKAIGFSVSATSPGIFAAGGHAVAQNVDAASGADTLNSASNPAVSGGYLVLYLTGQGLLDNAVATGTVASSETLSSPLGDSKVRIAGKDAPLIFIGMTPGLVGICQANIRVPDGVPPGDQPVVVSIGGIDSQTVSVSIGNNPP